MAEDAKNQIDTLTNKCTESFGKFSQSQSGNVILDFVHFRRNLLPYTLQIVFILGVVALWIIAVMGVLGQGPIGDICHEQVEKNGKYVMSFNFIKALGYSVAIFVFAPFVLHYVLELVKVLWKFVVHVYGKVLVPIWNTLVLRFFANVAPQVLPFLYERFMKAIDICMGKLEPLIDALIDLIVAITMTLIAVVKGVVWFPKTICRRIARWVDKSEDGKAVCEEK